MRGRAHRADGSGFRGRIRGRERRSLDRNARLLGRRPRGDPGAVRGGPGAEKAGGGAGGREELGAEVPDGLEGSLPVREVRTVVAVRGLELLLEAVLEAIR